MSPMRECVERRLHFLQQSFAGVERDKDCCAALHADRGYSSKAVAVYCLNDLFGEDVDQRLNFGFVLPVRQDVRGVSKAVSIERRLVKRFEVRVFTNEVV